MEALRRKIMDQQLAEQQQHHQGGRSRTSSAPDHSFVSNVLPRDKHAAVPRVKMYQPPPPPSRTYMQPGVQSSPGIRQSSSNPPGRSRGSEAPFRPPTMTLPQPTPSSFGVTPQEYNPFMPNGKDSTFLQGDPFQELEPPNYLSAPTITAEERDRQLQDMISNMVSLTDVDMSKAKLDGMKCVLLPHQIQGVQWMKDREMGKYKGGILADDMGLGKTVQMLALIVTNRPGMQGASIDNVADTPVKKRGPKSKYAPNTKAANSKHDITSRTSLIIAPLAVVKQWEREVHEKTDSGLKVYVHHGFKRAKTAATFAKYDVVVTTYSTAASEFSNLTESIEALEGGRVGSSSTESDSESSADELASPTKRESAPKKKAHAGKAKPSPLFETDWLRIVLDEAQNIKNQKAKCSKACFRLSQRAHSRWCLTGTPIQNNCYELFSLIHFLRIAPFDEYKHFKEKIGDPLQSTNQNRVNWGMKRLCVVLQTIMLRRTKDATHDGKPILQLPSRTVEVITEDFDNPEERTFYHDLEERIQANHEKEEQKAQEGQRTNQLTYLLMLLRLRQACSHPVLTAGKMSADQDAVTAPPPTATEAAEEEDELANLFNSLVVGTKRCDRCQTNLPEKTEATMCTSCIAIVKEMKWDHSKGSTKIRMMLKILDQIRNGDKAEKTIVFSQFTSFLDLVEPFLRLHKFNFVRYDGSMRPELREENLERIRSDPITTVILISFKAGSTGLNLTSCSRVVLMDLWWNPQIEEQAFDRAHRLGQQRDVHIYKLSITDTVEERILSLQNKKRGLAKAALEGSKLAKANKLDNRELWFLFNGNK